MLVNRRGCREFICSIPLNRVPPHSLSYYLSIELPYDPFNLLYLQVKIWFQNRRMKWRNSKERELLATGGSREQTLPNKNNPNPDLSDADGDRPRMDLSDVSPLTSPQRPEEQTENEEDEEINVT